MGVGEPNSLYDVKEFQDLTNPGELNSKGKYWQRKDKLAQGFVIMISALSIILLIAVIVFGTRKFGHKDASKTGTATFDSGTTTPPRAYPTPAARKSETR